MRAEEEPCEDGTRVGLEGGSPGAGEEPVARVPLLNPCLNFTTTHQEKPGELVWRYPAQVQVWQISQECLVGTHSAPNPVLALIGLLCKSS
jgi:hypothetical protein